MKKHILLCFALVLTLSRPVLAGGSYSNANNGIGIAIGDPGGITFFHKLDETAFIQAYVSRYLLLGADYNMVFPRAIHAIPELTPYVGAGAFLFTSNSWNHSRHHSGVGARIPLGLLLQVPNAPIQFHFEIAPSTTVIPFMYSFADAMIGVRFLF